MRLATFGTRDEWIGFFSTVFHGAEDSVLPTPPADPATPPATEPVITPGTGAPAIDKPKPEPETFPREYVEQLRRENADFRTRASTAEAKITEAERAKMSDSDRLKAEKEESDKKATALEATLRSERLESAIKLALVGRKFRDPDDTYKLIDISAIKVDDDGKPNAQSLKAALDKLATDKPYLLDDGTGSGDGGSRGSHQANTQQQFDQANVNRGMVPVP